MSTRFSAPTSRKIVALIVGAFVFLSAAHHLVDYWSKSMAWMLLLFAVCVPLLGWAIYRLYNLIAPHLKAIVPQRIFFWLSIAVPLALVFAWRSYSAPVSYHALTITPLVSSGQKIELLEIKADGVVLNIEQAALVKGWQKEGEVLVATSVSQPFTLSFKGSVNAPTGILFFASSGNDQVKTNLDGQINYINLAGLSGSQKLETYYLGYRSLPNWVFIALLIIIDTVVFGLLFLMVFFIQEIGELNLKQSGLSTAHFIQHRTNLLVLVFVSGSLHLINALSVPLMLDPDSPTYLQGAVYWLQQGNLDGVSMFRGPGTTFLFAPILFFIWP